MILREHLQTNPDDEGACVLMKAIKAVGSDGTSASMITRPVPLTKPLRQWTCFHADPDDR